MQIFAYQIDLYLEGDAYPRVRYVFYGESEKEIDVNVIAHGRVDPILRGALTSKRIGSEPCVVESRLRQVPFDRKGTKL